MKEQIKISKEESQIQIKRKAGQVPEQSME